MDAKKGGKVNFGKITSRLYLYPVGQIFCLNCPISNRFRDKCVFAFYAESQDGRQKWQESNFCENLPVDPAVTLWVKNFVEIAHLEPFPR